LGVVLAEFEPFHLTDHPELEAGLWAEPGYTYVAVVRYSRGLGVIKHQVFPDVAGMGIRIFKLKKEELLSARSFDDVLNNDLQWWDLTFTNSKSAFASTPEKFAQFFEIQEEPRLLRKVGLAVRWIWEQPSSVWRVATTAARPVSSILLQRFGSGHP